MSDELAPSPRVTAFLAALPYAKAEEFVAVPGLASWRARHVRRALEREVIVVHRTGYGFAFLTPHGHVGMCPNCSAHKGSICEHCACALCSWIRQSDERASPRVGRERLEALLQRMRIFRFAAVPSPGLPALDDDL